MINKNSKKILICDFGATLNYTHHFQFIKSNIMFINRNYKNVVIGVILPVASELNSNNFKPAHFTKKLLWPIYFFPHTKITLFSTWFTFIWRKFGQWICTFNPSLYLNISVFLILPYFIFCRANLIIFPTACAQSFKLIELLDIFHVKKSFHVHFSNTSEIRFPYGSIKNCENFIKRSNKFKFIDIVLSFDTSILFDFYSKLNVNNNFYLARPPSTHNTESLPLKLSSTTKSKIIKILIMGRPTDPGRDSLIIKSLQEFSVINRNFNLHKGVSFEFGVIFEDPSRIALTYNSFKNSFQIKKLYSKMNFLELVDLLITATIVVLPYNPSIYSKNHSGMIMLLSDLKIPIVTCDDAAFSPEVLEFKLGKLFDYELSFASALTEALSNFNDSRFNEYFQIREQENRKLFERFNIGF